MKLVRKQVLLEESTIPYLERIAEIKGVSVSCLLRWAVNDHLIPFFLPVDLIDSTIDLIQQSDHNQAA
ncbi:hypothetical protein [Herpetosiphon sp. NSE202]|uniref:hypothetical protein n=1 Tax=Herpetosiphon sp. NSE202 TaxID=3351349 RepID=UPI003633ACE5